VFCIKLVNYWDKYTEMYGQQNVKIWSSVHLSFCILLTRHSCSSSCNRHWSNICIERVSYNILGTKMLVRMWTNVSTTKYLQHYIAGWRNSGSVLQVVIDLALLLYPHIKITLNFVILPLYISLPLWHYQQPHFILLSFNHIYVA